MKGREPKRRGQTETVANPRKKKIADLAPKRAARVKAGIVITKELDK